MSERPVCIKILKPLTVRDFALPWTGPVAEAVGTGQMLVASGICGALATIGFMLVPGLYDTERDGALALLHADASEREEVSV